MKTPVERNVSRGVHVGNGPGIREKQRLDAVMRDLDIVQAHY